MSTEERERAKKYLEDRLKAIWEDTGLDAGSQELSEILTALTLMDIAASLKSMAHPIWGIDPAGGLTYFSSWSAKGGEDITKEEMEELVKQDAAEEWAKDRLSGEAVKKDEDSGN